MIQVARKPVERISQKKVAVNWSQEEEVANGIRASNRFVFEEEEETDSHMESPKQEEVQKFCSMFMIGKRNIFKMQHLRKVKSASIKEKFEESFKFDEDFFARPKKKEGFKSSLRSSMETKKGKANGCGNVKDTGIKHTLYCSLCSKFVLFA